MTAPGRMFLKVGGIFLIIGGAFSLFLALSSAFSFVMLGDPNSNFSQIMTEQFQNVVGIALPRNAFMVFALFYAISAILNFVAGIVGVRYCNRIDKARLCLLCILLVIMFELINTVMNVFSSGISPLATLLSLAFPAVYLWGAWKNKQAAENGF